MFPGITERYSVNRKALGTKTTHLASILDAKRSTYSIDGQLAQNVQRLVTDSVATLAAITMNDTGEETTGLQIDMRAMHEKITWANIDPPKLGTPVLDSLYRMMLHVEAEMIPPQ